MHQITINNYDDLLNFIKLDKVTAKQGTEVVCKVLKVVCFDNKTKTELINQTEYYIKTYCQNNNHERPIFLEQLNFECNIKEIYNAE